MASLVVGLAVGGAMCAIALDHNPQGEFRSIESGAIDWPHLLMLGGVWAVPTALAAFPIIAIIGVIWLNLAPKAGD
jgi:hypothetical protein